MSELDFGPPIRLPCSPFTQSPPAVTKLKRGGVGKQGNSGPSGAARRVRTPPRAMRNKVGVHVPWPDRGPAIRDPRDPFILAYQEAHRNPAVAVSPRKAVFAAAIKKLKRLEVQRLEAQASE